MQPLLPKEAGSARGRRTDRDESKNWSVSLEDASGGGGGASILPPPPPFPFSHLSSRVDTMMIKVSVVFRSCVVLTRIYTVTRRSRPCKI